MISELRPGKDPHPLYEKMRAQGPIYKDTYGPWVTTSHAVANQVLRHRQFRVRHVDGRLPDSSTNGSFPESFLETDQPDHTRLRRLAAPAFSPKKIDEYRVRVQKVTESLLGKDSFDLIDDFAAPLPIAVISDLLGVPDDETGSFAEYGALVASQMDGKPSKRMREADARITALFTRLIAERRTEPRDDVISSLVAAEAEHQLTSRELMGTLGLLLVAGFETTVNLIGNGTKLLLDHPEQWEALKADPDLAPDVVEEVLRHAPPVQLTGRVAHERFGDVRPDEEVYVVIGAANRDPEVYPDPHRFDITRDQRPEHLAFSSGIHYCLGATLARMEGDVAFRALAELAPNLRQAGRTKLRDSVVIRGYARFPVHR